MNRNKGFLTIPVAIIVAGIVIAAAIIYATKSSAPPPLQPQEEVAVGGVEKVKPVSSKDHILGNPKAAVKVVEFSDIECPFCKRFHATMHQLIDEYGKDGKVAWIYRHFPLDSLHSQARKEAEATECAGELGGNEKFWAYIDRLYEITPSNNRLNLAELPNIARYVGLDRKAFETCLNSGKQAARVEANYQDAVASGGQGTPYSIVIAQSGQKFVISGAQPYAQVKQAIEIALGLSTVD